MKKMVCAAFFLAAVMLTACGSSSEEASAVTEEKETITQETIDSANDDALASVEEYLTSGRASLINEEEEKEEYGTGNIEDPHLYAVYAFGMSDGSADDEEMEEGGSFVFFIYEGEGEFEGNGKYYSGTVYAAAGANGSDEGLENAEFHCGWIAPDYETLKLYLIDRYGKGKEIEQISLG